MQAKVTLLDEFNDLVFLQVDWTKNFAASAVPNMIANATLIGCCKMPPPVGGNIGLFNNAAAGAFALNISLVRRVSNHPFRSLGHQCCVHLGQLNTPSSAVSRHFAC